MSWRVAGCVVAVVLGGVGAAAAQVDDSAAQASGVYRPGQPSDTAGGLILAGDSLRLDSLMPRAAGDTLADSVLADTTLADSLTGAGSNLVDTASGDTVARENALQPVDEPEADDTSLTARMDAVRGGGLRREDFPDLLSTAAMTGQYRTFLGLVNRSKIQRLLSGSTEVTVLAPTDSAFAGLDRSDLDRLRNNSALRDAWLGTLVLNGSLKSGDLLKAGAVRSRGGSLVQFSRSDTLVRAGPARLVQPNLVARNGILHGVDRVVLPNATSASP